MKLHYKIASSVFALALLWSGCTDNFEDINIDEKKVTDEQIKADYFFIGGPVLQMQQLIYMNFNWGWGTDWTFQIVQNLNADIFSGYMMTPTPFAGGDNNHNYMLVDGWNSSAWDYTYERFMTESNNLRLKTEAEYPHMNAANKILRVAAMHRISDIYGPIIYTHYGESKTGGKFDSQKDAYMAFFKDLDDAVTGLDQYIKQYPGAKPLAKYDLLFGGDFSQWIKWANSLRLRLAIRISNVEPAIAKTQAEAALNNSYGVFEGSDVAGVKGASYTHPLATLSGGWEDIKMGAVAESILSGYQDPRLPKFFKPTTDEVVLAANYTYKGIRQGCKLTLKDIYVKHSTVNVAKTDAAILMSAAEVYFLRSEGALRGWNMKGTAKELYELGVKASMSQHGVAIGDYLASDRVAAPYIDVIAATDVNNVPEGSAHLNNVSPKWDDAASVDVKLQKIITQKWIAMFPEGQEAWSEFRRTGFPKLFPVVENKSQGKIEGFVKRLNFSVNEKSRNPEGYQEAVTLLGGPDTGGTRLWWDVANKSIN